MRENEKKKGKEMTIKEVVKNNPNWYHLWRRYTQITSRYNSSLNAMIKESTDITIRSKVTCNCTL